MAQGLPVIVVTKNGLPVSAAAAPYGLPVTVSTNGFGLAVVPVASGGRPVFDTSGTLFGPAVIPANLTPPVITGTTAVDSTLMTSSGTWSGSAATYTYQWKRGGVNISGATSSSYLLVSADLGTMITVTVTATNTAGSASATSAAAGPITVAAPVNSVLPVISGTTKEGQTLSTTTGTWSGSPSYGYQWRRNGSSIGGAVTSTYLLVPADVDAMISVMVFASNSGGGRAAVATAVGPIASAAVNTAPVNISLPAITGTPSVGTVLNASSGGWTGSPTPTYAYQWQRGVPDGMPVNTLLPVITGPLAVGSTLAVTDGTWTGTPTPTYARQWKRDGVNIAGATASTYLLVSADLGTVISATVTATNVAGSANANAVAVGPITGVTSTTFNPATLSEGPLTLSNGNLTATSAGVAGAALSTTSYATGKKYCKFTTHATAGVGIVLWNGANASPLYAGIYGSEGVTIAGDGNIWYGSGNNPTNNGGNGVFYFADNTTHVVEVLVDIGAKLLWFRMDGGNWNNSAGANPAAATGGADWATGTNPGPYFMTLTLGTLAGDTGTVDFAAASPVAGFGNW